MVATVSMREAKNRLTELARRVERGERVVVMRNGKPVFDLVPHEASRGLNVSALAEFEAKHGLDELLGPIPADFDAPLPEDILLAPLPDRE